MNFDDLFPPSEDNTGGTYTTGRSEKEPNNQVGTYIALSLLLTVSIILFGVIGHIVDKSRTSTDDSPPSTEPELADSPDKIDCIVDYTWDNKDYCGFLFRPYNFELPDNYILTSSEIFSADSDAMREPITVTDSNGQKYNAHFQDKNDDLGVALLLIHGDNLPENVILCDNSSYEEATLYLDATSNEKHTVSYEKLVADCGDHSIDQTFLKLDSLPKNTKQGTPIFNDKDEIIAVIAKPDIGSDKQENDSGYAAASTDINNWVWDTLLNPLRDIGIHGNLSSAGRFQVDYVEALDNYNLSQIESGDYILSYCLYDIETENDSQPLKTELSTPEALDKLYNDYTTGQNVIFTLLRNEIMTVYSHCTPNSASTKNDAVHSMVDIYCAGEKLCRGFLFQPDDLDVSGSYILCSLADIQNYEDISDGREHDVNFLAKNDELGLMLFQIADNALPGRISLSQSNFSFAGTQNAFVYMANTPDSKFPVKYKKTFGRAEDKFFTKTFWELTLLPGNVEFGTPLFNEADQVVAITAPPGDGVIEKKPDSLYAVSIADVNTWLWDTLENPLRIFGIHGKIVSSANDSMNYTNSGFLVESVENTGYYDFTGEIEKGDIILGYFDNYSQTRPNGILNTNSLNSLCGYYFAGKTINLSILQADSAQRKTVRLHKR